MIQSMMRTFTVIVYLCFDIEDLVHPDSDDIAYDLATMLADDGVVGSMFVVGEKARLWERRGRQDVISAVGLHDVGLHTDRHSHHPTVSEYLADCGWAEGVAEAVRQEGPGVRDLTRLFGRYPTGWGTGGAGWGPQIPAAMRQLGVPGQVYAHVRAAGTGASWFAGELCYREYMPFPGYEDGYADDDAFDTGLPRFLDQITQAQRAGFACYGLFVCHPTRLRYKEFWDILNFRHGQNTPPTDYRFAPRRSDNEYQTSLRNLRRMVWAVRDLPGIEIMGTGALNQRFGGENAPVAWTAIQQLAQAVADSPTLGVSNPVASPAQTLDLLARAALRLAGGSPPAFLPSRTALGPAEPPPILEKPLTLPAQAAVALCRALVQHIDTTGHLPTRLHDAAVPLGPGALLRGLAVALPTWEQQGQVGEITLLPGTEEPESAAPWAARWIDEAVPRWGPHRPDLRVDQLSLHTRLQSWSLKPAMLAG